MFQKGNTFPEVWLISHIKSSGALQVVAFLRLREFNRMLTKSEKFNSVAFAHNLARRLFNKSTVVMRFISSFWSHFGLGSINIFGFAVVLWLVRCNKPHMAATNAGRFSAEFGFLACA